MAISSEREELLSRRWRIAVLGGGITGLAAAHRLRELAAAHEYPLEVTLLEAGRRLGGAIHTLRRGDFITEAGADSFLTEKPAALDLARRLGLEAAIIRTQEQFRRTMVVRGGRLLDIPEGFSLIAPARFGPVLRSPLFSTVGKLRMLLEPLIPRRRAASDESLAAFVSRRMGREVLERVAQPLAAGIYTGDPLALSAKATLPRFVEMEQRYGSVVRGLRQAARRAGPQACATSGARWSLFVSFADGMGELVDALRTRIDTSIRYDAEVRGLTLEAKAPGSGSRWRIELADGTSCFADAALCATPASITARLLEHHDDALADELRAISYASAAVVNLGFQATDFSASPAAFGFVVPIVEGRRIIAGSFSSLKFPGRAPADMVLVRVFLGGALQAEMLTHDDDALLAAARSEFRSLFGVNAEPCFADIRRWPDAMPQYVVGHHQRVSSIRARAANFPGLFIAGAYLEGVGIPDCIRMGEAAAEAALSHVRALASLT